jgi:hypothetical protein
MLVFAGVALIGCNNGAQKDTKVVSTNKAAPTTTAQTNQIPPGGFATSNGPAPFPTQPKAAPFNSSPTGPTTPANFNNLQPLPSGPSNPPFNPSAPNGPSNPALNPALPSSGPGFVPPTSGPSFPGPGAGATPPGGPSFGIDRAPPIMPNGEIPSGPVNIAPPTNYK